jgi:hypothetical protein
VFAQGSIQFLRGSSIDDNLMVGSLFYKAPTLQHHDVVAVHMQKEY